MIGTKKNVSEAEQDSETLEAIADDASDDADGHEGEQDEQSDAQTDADESVGSQLNGLSKDYARALRV